MRQTKAVTGKCCIRVGAMKLDALATPDRVDTIGAAILEQVPFHAGF